MSATGALLRAPAAAIEFANILLTRDDARVGVAPKDVVWTHRRTTLYRYRSSRRRHAIPVVLIFALINRADIFDLRPGHSFVEFLLEEGFDVWLLDWGVPDDEDGDTGVEYYVCDAIPWGLREVRRHSGQDEVSLIGWCIGGALCAMHAALDGDAVRNLALLTTDRDHGLAVPALGRHRRLRRGSRRVGRPGDRRPRHRLRQQADEAGHELLDHQPPAGAAGL